MVRPNSVVQQPALRSRRGLSDVRLSVAIVGALVISVDAMALMAVYRPPHPGSPLAARLVALRGLWTADQRGARVALALAMLVLVVDVAVVWVWAAGRARRPPRNAGGAIAGLAVLTLLQVGHQGEHVAQVVELLVTGGNADLSQGVLTRLNQEVVHAVWTSCIWVGCLALLWRLRRNPWLWMLLAAASFHEVEHLYLFFAWLNNGIYLHGGVNGIFSSGGLISGPLQRPYLHFLYNSLSTLLLVAALCNSLRSVGAQPLVTTSRAEIGAR